MVERRARAVSKQRLTGRPKVWGGGIEVVVMDGFCGFEIDTAEELPDADPVMDPSTSPASPATRSTTRRSGVSRPAGSVGHDRASWWSRGRSSSQRPPHAVYRR